jgi:hypothetical protein
MIIVAIVYVISPPITNSIPANIAETTIFTITAAVGESSISINVETNPETILILIPSYASSNIGRAK